MHTPNKSRKNTGAGGFTLLEAIVALTIIGLTLVPAMSFLAQATRQLSAAAESNRRVAIEDTVIAFSETLNPILSPEGEIALSPTLSLRWVSTVLVDPSQSKRIGGRLGGFSLGFYAVDFTVLDGEREWFSLTTQNVGYLPQAATMPGVTP
jgi:type II secretory pathway pseudopilin PulG